MLNQLIGDQTKRLLTTPLSMPLRTMTSTRSMMHSMVTLYSPSEGVRGAKKVPSSNQIFCRSTRSKLEYLLQMSDEVRLFIVN